jgi:Response regulator containing a CheY-like receiver domain and an HTH DNA-binding domain
MIHLLICDDQSIVTAGLSTILGSSPEIEVIGTASDGVEAVQKAEALQPEIILMDLKMPLMNGIEATSAIHAKFPTIKILVLTTYDADEWVFDSIRAGAAGYLLKDTPPVELIKAVIDTASGKNHIDPAIAGRLLDKISQGSVAAPSNLQIDLTERELEVLELLTDGYSNAQISQQLFLSSGTVRNIVSSILVKLGVEDRTQAAIFSLKHGLIKHERK